MMDLTLALLPVASSLPPSQVRFLTTDGPFAIFNDLSTGGGMHETLWITDGTAAGTHEITGITGAGGAAGLIPQDLAQSNGLVLFEGLDTAGNEGFWISNGTGTGTVELNPANANANGIFDGLGGMEGRPDFTTFGNKALFQGSDAAQNLGLWVTDYTSAGTHEITGITGANLAKFAPDSFIVYEGKAYFAAQNNTSDNDDGGNLWVTDGTAAGTTQIHAAAEGSHGFFSEGNSRANPSFTIVNGTLMFRGVDSTGALGTWAYSGSGSPVEISTVTAQQPVVGGPDLVSFRSPVSQTYFGDSSSNILIQNGSGVLADWACRMARSRDRRASAIRLPSATGSCLRSLAGRVRRAISTATVQPTLCLRMAAATSSIG
jgi:ELWxxDGT repeat protein